MVSGEDVLSRLRKVPVSTWNYITGGREARYLGPTAEDFYGAFGLGTSNASVGVQDLAGVSLAAVKALDERTAELRKKTGEVETLRPKVDTLERRLAALEQLLRAQAGEGQPRQ
jgi:trimeric autotransporter adhesin